MDIIEIVRSANASASESVGYGDIENAKQHLYYATECLKQIPEGAISEALVYSLAASLLNNWGMISLQPGSYDAKSSEDHFSEAINKELKAMELQPGIVPPDVHAQTLCNMSVALLKQGKYKESIFHSKMAIATLNNFESWDNRIRSLMSVCQYNLGVALEQRGELIEAMTAYKTAQDMNPADENFGKVLEGAYKEIQSQLKKKNRRIKPRSIPRSSKSRSSRDSRRTSKPPSHPSVPRDPAFKKTAKDKTRTKSSSEKSQGVPSPEDPLVQLKTESAEPSERTKPDTHLPDSDTRTNVSPSASHLEPPSTPIDPVATLRIVSQPVPGDDNDPLEESVTVDHTFVTPSGTIIHVRGSEIAQRNPFSSRYTNTPLVTPVTPATDNSPSSIPLGPIATNNAPLIPQIDLSATIKPAEEMKRRFLDPSLFPPLPTTKSQKTDPALTSTPARVQTAPSTSFTTTFPHTPPPPDHSPTNTRNTPGNDPSVHSPRPSTAPYHTQSGSPFRDPFHDTYPAPVDDTLAQTFPGPMPPGVDTLHTRLWRQQLDMETRYPRRTLSRAEAILLNRPAWDNTVRIDPRDRSSTGGNGMDTTMDGKWDTQTRLRALGSVYNRKNLPTVQNPNGRSSSRSGGYRGTAGTVGTSSRPGTRTGARAGNRPGIRSSSRPNTQSGTRPIPSRQQVHDRVSRDRTHSMSNTFHGGSMVDNTPRTLTSPMHRTMSYHDLSHAQTRYTPRPLSRSNTLPTHQWPSIVPGTPTHPQYPAPQMETSAYFQYPSPRPHTHLETTSRPRAATQTSPTQSVVSSVSAGVPATVPSNTQTLAPARGGVRSVSEFIHSVQMQAHAYAEEILSRKSEEKRRDRDEMGMEMQHRRNSLSTAEDNTRPEHAHESLPPNPVHNTPRIRTNAPAPIPISAMYPSRSGNTTPGSVSPRPVTDIATHLESAVHHVFDSALRSAMQRRSSIVSTSSTVSAVSATSATSATASIVSAVSGVAKANTPVSARTHSFTTLSTDTATADTVGIAEARVRRSDATAAKNVVPVPVEMAT